MEANPCSPRPPTGARRDKAGTMPHVTGLAKTHFLENTDLRSLLEPEPVGGLHAASKVVGTLGPACRDVETLVELLNAGMTAARVDLTVIPEQCDN